MDMEGGWICFFCGIEFAFFLVLIQFTVTIPSFCNNGNGDSYLSPPSLHNQHCVTLFIPNPLSFYFYSLKIPRTGDAESFDRCG